MRIGFFTDEFLPRTDGVVTSMINLKKGLEARGHEVFIIAPEYPGYHDEPNGIVRLRSMSGLVYDNIRFPFFGRKTVDQLAELKLDVIHAQTNFWASALAYRVAQKTKAPLVASVHVIAPELYRDYRLQTWLTHLFMPPIMWHFFGRFDASHYHVPEHAQHTSFFEKRGWKMLGLYIDLFDHCVVPSQHFAEDLKEVGVETPLTVLPNSIDTAAYAVKRSSAKKKVFNIVAVGRLSGEKRQDALIRAAAILKEKELPFHLTLVGTGPKQREYRHLVDRLVLNKHVSFTGLLEPHDVKQFLAQADVSALVSENFDNQPMVVLEYAASGLPILYCDPRLREGLNTDNAYLSKPDPESLAEALIHLAHHPEERVDMSEASVATAQEFDVTVKSKEFEKLYQSLLKR